ncbi:transmembrane emp24 domain-containing protein p24delta9 [Vigna radiata var. radiata]|uniref:Transmembrane emp24 domain-containing protein p24delta9 n=1 Tax=Vigna radiata var. radiata TaxID=3916 RepID=A0A1S3TTU4_VIGRR|nr:transmembrane emp24 domain-containing protein p24delta9 [Vigna radiata var. radiata]
MSNLPLLMVFLLAPALMCSIVESMMFELKSPHTKCISEDIKANTFSSGNYHVINPNSVGTVPDHHKIIVRVRSPNGNGYHIGDNVLYGEFAFTAAESGDYSACFTVAAHTTDTVTVDFVWKSGVAAKDWKNGGRKSHIDEMEMELKKLNDAVTSIHDEMFYLRERETERQFLTDETNSKMFNYSFLSILVCLSVAGLQLWHLKTFFERKKLL